MGLNNLREKAAEKADRKFKKKVQFYSKVRSTIAATQTTKTKSKSAKKREKKVKAYDLSTLTELLPQLESDKGEVLSDKFKLNGKSRRQLLLKEGKQFASVVSHPAFHSDPFSAIHQHLCSTQPVIEEPEKDEEKKKKKKKNSNGSTRRKRKKRAAASLGQQPQSMEL